MVDLKTDFIGLTLKSPIIAGSCGLTSDVNRMKEMEKNGVGAVILKSIFEEQILMDTERTIEATTYPGQEDYIRIYTRENSIQQYIDMIRQAKSHLTIPVIASVNCLKDGEWVEFARKIEAAGADALELNVFVLPMDEFQASRQVAELYYNVVRHVKSILKLPLIIKISHNFTNLPAFVSKLKSYGANAVTLFNRFYEPDIDIDKVAIGSAPVFSLPTDLRVSLRWTGILAGKDPQLQISSSTGVHDGEAVVKMLLAGATTVQVCSVLYENGIPVIKAMNEFLREWMRGKAYQHISEFRGKLSYADVENANRYERAQFMKYFSSSGFSI